MINAPSTARGDHPSAHLPICYHTKMSRSRAAEPALPACYAIVLPGLESVAADEITRDMGAEIKKAERGIVLFRTDSIGPDLLKLRTVEDVFLMAWGTDSLSYR